MKLSSPAAGRLLGYCAVVSPILTNAFPGGDMFNDRVVEETICIKLDLSKLLARDFPEAPFVRTSPSMLGFKADAPNCTLRTPLPSVGWRGGLIDCTPRDDGNKATRLGEATCPK